MNKTTLQKIMDGKIVSIVRKVANRARGFDMKVLAYDPYVKELPAEYAGFVTLCDLE